MKYIISLLGNCLHRRDRILNKNDQFVAKMDSKIEMVLKMRNMINFHGNPQMLMEQARSLKFQCADFYSKYLFLHLVTGAF
jgi:hypothetical protein